MPAFLAQWAQQKNWPSASKGFTPRTSRLASEYAREHGWDTNEEQRSQTSLEKQPYDGGRDYEYGAQDFGDTAEDTSKAVPDEEKRPPDGRE